MYKKCQDHLIETFFFSTHNKSFEKVWLQLIIIDNKNYFARYNRIFFMNFMKPFTMGWSYKQVNTSRDIKYFG